MITLDNATKLYVNSNGLKNVGIKNISLELNSFGFISIIGRSGSGKSTLLNILAGYDRIDYGIYKFDEMEISLYNEMKLDDFKRNQIGFVFQDFNLLSDLNVYDNIAISFSNSVNENKIDGVLELLEIEHCKYKKINEISGGEAQRVAIARSIIKEPKVIFADEPTGNLDEKSAEKILNHLKKLSKTMLIVLVTHDRNYAFEYSDIIYEMKDGEIVNEVVVNKLNSIDNKKVNTCISTKLPINIRNNLIRKHLFSSKLSLIRTILLFCLSFLLFYFTISIVTFDVSESSIKTFESNKINQYVFSQINDSDDDAMNYYSNNLAFKKNIIEINREYSNGNVLLMLDAKIAFKDFQDYQTIETSSIDNAAIENLVIYNSDDISEIIIGNESDAEDSIVITDYVAHMMIKYNIINVQNIDDIIGETILFPIMGNEYEMTISGLVDTDYELYSDQNYDNNDQLYQDLVIPKIMNEYSSIFLTQDNMNYLVSHGKITSVLLEDTNQGVFASKFGNYDYLKNKYEDMVVYGVEPSTVEEISIPLTLILELEDIDKLDFDNNKDMYLDKYLNKSYKLDSVTNKYNLLSNTYIVTSIIDDFTFQISDYERQIIYVNSMLYGEVFEYNTDYLQHKGKVFLNGIYDIELFNEIHMKYNILAPTSMYLFDVESTINQLVEIIYVITVVVVGLVYLQINSFVNKQIELQKKNIGILRSLGISKKSVSSLFVNESILYVFMSLITFLIAGYALNSMLNYFLYKSYNFYFSILYYNLLRILLIVCFSFLIAIVSSLLPLKKILKRDPIKTIKTI